MIQDDDNTVVSKISEHTDRICRDISISSVEVVRNLIAKAVHAKLFKHKEVNEVIVAHFRLAGGVTENIPNNLYATLHIPNEYRLDTKHKPEYKIRKEIVEKIYLKILDKVTELLPSAVHDLHQCEIGKIELLDYWSKYEAQL